MKPNAQRRPRRLARGLTLIEILVVVTILGLIAGIVGVAVVGQLEETQVDTTRTQIKNIENALDIYKMKFGSYPSSTEGLGVLANPPNNRNPIMETIPKDPWGGDFVYISPGQHNPASFDIYSKGPDQQGGTGDDITNWSE
jgi:general secretion pathway protein G